MNCYGNNFILTANTGSYNIFIDGPSGDVGISTNSPQNTFDVNGGVAFGAFGGSSVAPSNGMIVSGDVGIGTPAPVSMLDVAGGVTVGSYAGINAAPANGLIVSGNMGVGTNSPNSQFEVGGAFAAQISKQAGSTTVTLDNTATVWYFTGSAKITLPPASGCANRIYKIVNRSSSPRTLTSSSFTNLSGSTGITSIAGNTSVELISDGSNWLQIE